MKFYEYRPNNKKKLIRVRLIFGVKPETVFSKQKITEKNFLRKLITFLELRVQIVGH